MITANTRIINNLIIKRPIEFGSTCTGKYSVRFGLKKLQGMQHKEMLTLMKSQKSSLDQATF